MAPTVWQPATIISIRAETATAKTFRLRLTDYSPHLPGQHYILKLTAPDGYSASRSYSVASAPDPTPEIELTVERLPDGEVSTFLHDEAAVGDELEVRGPIGGWFVWNGDRPALLVGGGSGIVPLMAMLRHARSRRLSDQVRAIVSVRTPSDLYYADEYPGPEASTVYTRTARTHPPRPPGRITADDLEPILRADATVFICGSSPFADAATDALTSLDVSPERIRVERFGPS